MPNDWPRPAGRARPARPRLLPRRRAARTSRRRASDPASGPAAHPGGTGGGDEGGGVRARTAPVQTARVTARRGSAEHERLEELKQDVHSELLKQLGPQLYDANLDQADLDQRVRTVLSQLMSSQERPISNADRNRLTQEISDDILGLRPDRAVPARRQRLRGHGQRRRLDLAGEGRQAAQGQRAVQRRGPRPPDHRQDRVAHRPSRRRVEPDGRRPAPRRQPCQRGGAAAGGRRLVADDP